MAVSLFSFEACFVDGNTKATDKLYANGNHQVRVAIRIIKQVNGVNTPLTDEEKESVTITARSTDTNVPLYPDWSCDKIKNEYDEGLLGDNKSIDSAVNSITSEDEDRKENIYRYLRTNTENYKSMEFMAVVTIDGNKYTTNMQKYLNILKVTPHKPYRIYRSELRLESNLIANHEFEEGYYVKVYILCWVLPYSLTIKKQELIGHQDTWLGITVYKRTSDNQIQAGTVLEMDIVKKDCRIEDTMAAAGLPYGDWPIAIINGNQFIRATVGCCDKFHYTRDEDNLGGHINIIDNFGCLAKFFVMRNIDNMFLHLEDVD